MLQVLLLILIRVLSESAAPLLCRAIFESSVPSLPDLENLSKGSARAPSVCASVEARSKALATYLIYSLQDSVYKTGGAPKGVYILGWRCMLFHEIYLCVE